MSEEQQTNRRGRYGKRREFKADFPLLTFPEDSKLSIKNIAYLHAYCRLQPDLIVSRYPKVLTLADVHLALAHYFRDREPVDAEIKRELAFNSRDSLGHSSMTLPGVGLQSLAELASE